MEQRDAKIRAGQVNGEEEEDLLAQLLKRDEATGKPLLSRQAIADNIKTFLFAGHDTTYVGPSSRAFRTNTVTEGWDEDPQERLGQAATGRLPWTSAHRGRAPTAHAQSHTSDTHPTSHIRATPTSPIPAVLIRTDRSSLYPNSQRKRADLELLLPWGDAAH